MMTEKEKMMYDFLIEFELFTENDLNLFRSLLMGSWENIMNHMIYATYGYRDFESMAKEISEILARKRVSD